MTMTEAHIREGWSKAKLAAYALKIRNAQRKIGRLGDRGVKAIIRDLETARRNIILALVNATEFGGWHLPQVKGAVEDALSSFRAQATTTLANHAKKAWELGIERVSLLARASGVEVVAPSFPFAVPMDQLELAQSYSADLIQGETDSIRKRITRSLRQAQAGGLDRAQLISKVQNDITKPLRFKSMKSRAEAIVRTETNRIHNAAADAARQKMSADNVKVRKVWVSSKKGPARERENHLAIDGQVVDVDKPFRLVGVDGRLYWPMYPLDGSLPAAEAVNCGCTAIEVFEVLDEEDAAEVAEMA